MTRVKICCISSIAEARVAIRAGASAVGFVSEMPSGPGVISDASIAEIAATMPPPIATFLLTSLTDAVGIIEQQRRCGVNTLQLCDRVSDACRAELRRSLPGISIVQVVHVTGDESADEALRIAPQVNAILLDSGNPAGSKKELGGTGRTHNWAISARIVRACSIPVFLAGGLNPENAGEAIRAVRPFAVDVCSGVRTNNALDEPALASFMTSVESTGA